MNYRGSHRANRAPWRPTRFVSATDAIAEAEREREAREDESYERLTSTGQQARTEA